MRINKKVLILLFLFLIQIFTITDLTYLNCPDKFQIATANISNPSQTIVNFFYSSFDNDQHKTRVQSIIITGDTQDLSLYVSQLLIPYIVIAVIYFIFLMIVICCNVFQKSCPPCQSWKRDFVRRPYQKFELKCVMVFTMIFAITAFIICIVMFTSFPKFKQQAQLTKCSLFNMLDITKNGEQTENWGGFNQLKNQVGNISTLLTTTSFQINKNLRGADGLSNDDWIIDDMFKLKTTNLNIYRNNNDSVLITSNPTDTANVPLGDPLPTITSEFILKGMGPNGTLGTMVDIIDKGIRYLQNLSNQAYAVQRAAFILVDSATLIKANTESSQKSLQMFDSQLNSVQKQLNQFSVQYFDQLFNWGLYVIQGVVGFILAASLFIIFGTISTHILDIFQCRTLVNLGWIIYGIAYFGVIILSAVLLSGGSLAYGFCNYFDGMLNNQLQFNRIGQYYSQNTLNRLDVCIYGDGNVLTKFNVGSQMETVTQLFKNIQTYYNYQDSTSPLYINKTVSIQKIQGWINAMQKYRLGIYNDSNDALTTDSNPRYALDNFNDFAKFINAGTGTVQINCPRDIWVFDKTNCTNYPTAQIYSATTDVNNGLRFTTTNDLCISFNQKLISTGSNIWNFRDFKQRYIQVVRICPAYQEILQYGQALINYRDSRINLFQGLKDQLTTLLNLNTKFNNDLTGYKARVDTFYSSVSTLNNLVMDKISGLLVSSDCRVVHSQLKFTNNVFCKNLMAQVSALGICSIILMALLIGGILTASVFAIRYARVQTIQKHTKRIIIPQGSLMSQTFQKKQESEDSSSSSDED